MNSFYEKEHMLPYVTKDIEPSVQNKPSIFKPRQNNNGLATAAFIAALSSILIGFFILPSVLGIALGVGALIVAVKRGLPKKMPVISIGISIATLLISTVGLLFVLSETTPKPDAYVPPSFTYDSPTGLAYKYNPISNIVCNDKGECPVEVTVFRADAGQDACISGGLFHVQMSDLQTGLQVPQKSFAIPALKEGEQHTEKVVVTGLQNGRLVATEGFSHNITCS